MVYDRYDYNDVSEFFDLVGNIKPQTIASIFVKTIRKYPRLYPVEYLEIIKRDNPTKERLIKIIEHNKEHALFVAEYYIWWESLSKWEKKQIRNQRYFAEGNGDYIKKGME